MSLQRAAPAWLRRTGVLLLDAALVAAALAVSFGLRFDAAIPERLVAILWLTMPIAVGVKLPVFLAFRLDRMSWRHLDARAVIAIGTACAAGSAAFAIVLFSLRHAGAIAYFPRSILAIDVALTFLAISGVRFSRRLVGEVVGTRRGPAASARRALVVGAGDAGAQLVRALQQEGDRSLNVVGFVDDDPHKWGALLRGVPIFGPRKALPALVAKLRASSLFLAMPSATRDVIRETIALARETGVQDVRIVPDLAELSSGHITSADLRELQPADVLRREEVRVAPDPIVRFLAGKRVLVTGAAGSIGSELCRQVLRFGAARLVALDQNETGLFDLEADLSRRFPNADVAVVVADVRDRDRIRAVVASENPDAIYHAAAYKHVPLMERHPGEAARTNVEGTRNVVDAAREANSEAFVLISTDKAVNPSSVMGATKRVAELLVRDAAPPTRALAVRFGNVLGSRGSVLGTFQDQVQARRPLTVTDPAMERYFMVTSEAVQLVLLASAVGSSGQVLVLDMGKPVKIVDLARDVIRFYGLEPDVDVPIVYTGVRPGEKLFEELLTAEEGTEKTEHERLFVARLAFPNAGWRGAIDDLLAAARRDDGAGVRAALERLVPTYRAADAGP